MKKVICILVISFIPCFLLSQPVKEHTTAAFNLSSETAKVSKNDIVRPVLLRNYSNDFYDTPLQRNFTQKPGLAFLSSAILPGSSQMINKNWIRGGIYAAVEVATVYLVVDLNNRGKKNQRRYNNFADQNWSVTQYAQWIVNYHDYNGIDNPHIESLRTMVEGIEPAFDTSVDWQNIDINILRDVERNTPFISSDAQQNIGSTNFSHTLPAYGSQQYYELVSKYYQFQAGWRDYNTEQFFIDPTGSNASDMFIRGATLAGEFNSNFRLSKNLRILLVANHLVSAFDSFFTFKLKQSQIQATTSMSPASIVSLNYVF